MSTRAPAMSPSDTPYTEVLDRVTGPHRATTGCLHITRLVKVDVGVLRTLVERTVRVARAVDAAIDR